MAERNNPHIGDVGTEIIIDMGKNISGATLITFELSKNGGVEISWSAAVRGTNEFVHTIASGEFDVAGSYVIHPKFTLGAWSGRGKKVTFDVEQ